MGNVIHANFGEDDGSGYLITGKLNNKKVTGIYVNSIAAMVEYDNVYIGTKSGDDIENATLTTMEDINQFCLMWLLTFKPSVIIEDKE